MSVESLENATVILAIRLLDLAIRLLDLDNRLLRFKVLTDY